MTPSFESVWALTDAIPGYFARDEALELYEQVAGVMTGGRLLEVGCEHGRSTSVLAQVAVVAGHWLTVIDAFLTYDGTAKPKFLGTMDALGMRPPQLKLLPMKTREVRTRDLPEYIDLLHVDGDHSAEAVEYDLIRLAPRVVVGGKLVMHDYGRDSLPDVKRMADEVLHPRWWAHLGVVGSLGVWRRTT